MPFETMPVTVEQCEAVKLLPCPFCGGSRVKTFGPYGWYRQWGISHSCKSFYNGSQEMFQGFPTEAYAIAAWNTRATPPSPVGLAEAAAEHRSRLMLLELLAVIHRDGGHKTQEIGISLAWKQAMQLSSERIVLTANASQSERVVEVLREARKHLVTTSDITGNLSWRAELRDLSERIDALLPSPPEEPFK